MELALLAIVVILLVSSTSVYVALGLSSIAAIGLFTSIPLEIVGQRMFAGIDKFSLMAVPFFILAANVMRGGGLSNKILDFANAFVGHKKGGLAMTVVLSCMFFGAVSGSSPATVVAIGALMVPALREARYSKEFTMGLITSSSAIAVIIPPSIGMIVYGSVTGVSVGDLFLAGVVPGILFGLVFMVYSYIYAKRNDLPVQPKKTGKEKWEAFKDASWALGIPVIIIGGIYGGIFTPTEAAAVAAVYAILISLFVYKNMTFKELLKASSDSVVGTAQIMILISAASVFAWVLTSQQVPQKLAESLVTISSSKVVILLIVNVILLITGMFIDGASSTTILAPLLFPLTKQFGIDPIHLGIIMVVNGAIGMFTPPFGLNLFVATGLDDSSINDIIRGAIPFIILSIIALLLITFIPELSLFVPNLSK